MCSARKQGRARGPSCWSELTLPAKAGWQVGTAAWASGSAPAAGRPFLFLPPGLWGVALSPAQCACPSPGREAGTGSTLQAWCMAAPWAAASGPAATGSERNKRGQCAQHPTMPPAPGSGPALAGEATSALTREIPLPCWPSQPAPATSASLEASPRRPSFARGPGARSPLQEACCCPSNLQ